MAYLVITLKDGRRAWYRDTETRLDRSGVSQQVPRFDDERGKELSLAFAIDAAKAWRSYCLSVFDSDLQIVQEKYGQPFEVGDSLSGTLPADARRKYFITFTSGLGLFVTPGRNAYGEAWFVRAVDVPVFADDNKHTAIESVSGATPEEAAQRAVDSWGQQILFADPEVVDRQGRERLHVEQQRFNRPGLRPGDR